jgi:hypothetical protein
MHQVTLKDDIYSCVVEFKHIIEAVIRSTKCPMLRASMKSVSLRRSRNLPFALFRVKNQRQTGIAVV